MVDIIEGGGEAAPMQLGGLRLRYDPIKDFAPIVRVGELPFALVEFSQYVGDQFALRGRVIDTAGIPKQ